MTFDVAVRRVLDHEGGYVYNPNDPGGETHWGISQRAYPHTNIKRLTREDAIAIYKRDFWDVIQGDTLPSAVAFQVFDFAVNSGIQTALRAYQRALGVAPDGHFGPVSLKASLTVDTVDQILGIVAERLYFMTQCKGWAWFGQGWVRRMVTNIRYGIRDTP